MILLIGKIMKIKKITKITVQTGERGVPHSHFHSITSEL
jgi:hypothetical protein